MTDHDYAQEISANFMGIDGLIIILNVRDIEKRFEVTELKLERIQKENFILGEKLRLLYSNKVHWELRRYNQDITVDKYLRRD